MPLALWIGRLCERFHCLPSAAFQEWQQTPCGWLEEVLEALAYADAKAVFDRAQSRKDLPQTPMMHLVKTIDLELAQEDISGRPADD